MLFDGEARRPFVVGDKVVVLSHGFTGDSVSYKDTVKTVNKKTGNFTLVGRDGQWRQFGYRAGAAKAWSRETLVHTDDPRVAKAEESLCQSKAKYAFKLAAEQACKANLKTKDYSALEQAITAVLKEHEKVEDNK